MSYAWICVLACCASYGLTAWLLHHSKLRGIVDRPNERSSHTMPTPRGGGLSMVVVTTCAAILLCATARMPVPLTLVVLVGGLSVAAVGFLDDVRSASITLRMSVHIGAALLTLCMLDSPLRIGIAGALVVVLAITWVLNLFNFMDGIDGLAASEAAFVLFAAGGLALLVGHASPSQVAPLLIAAAACVGFLAWNWPPASIFMGDVGSGYLGYLIAAFAIASSRSGTLSVYVWLILGGVFIVDATLTLARRLVRGERVHQAHRTHAYQWLARRWGSHARVTIVVIAVNLAWLLPCALLAEKYRAVAPWICALALLPLAAGALLSGSGRRES
jgi:Fuc2NAc and GlcNAc transferase